MEGIFLGQAVDGVFSIDKTKLTFEHERRTHESHSAIRYSDCDYVLVESDDVIKTNDELLKLRNKVTKLEAELTEVKTARNLREAYIAGVEKGCESLREERDYWKDRFGSVVTDVSKVLESNGVEFTVKAIDGNKWNVGIDIPELNEAKKKVEDLEKKLAASKSNETFWRDRKEEEEDYHHYWLHTFDRVVKQAAEKGVHIGVRGNDEECNAGIVVVDNMKAEELEKQVVALDEANQGFNQQVLNLENDYQKLNQKYAAADNALEYWNNTYNDIVINGKNVGVKIDIKGKKHDSNAGFVYVTNETGLGLAYKLSDMKQRHDEKWKAMLDALKEKGVEVIYMGEQDDKPIVDVKITEIDILRKDGVLKGQQFLKLKADLNDLKKEYGRVLSELAELKSKTVAEARYEWKPDCFTLIYTMCDGSKQSTGADLSHEHINCLCKNYVDTESISHGTIPKCSSCSHFMHNPSRFAHDWCYMPVPKEGGAGYIRKLNKEEAEGPACSDFKAKE